MWIAATPIAYASPVGGSIFTYLSIKLVIGIGSGKFEVIQTCVIGLLFLPGVFLKQSKNIGTQITHLVSVVKSLGLAALDKSASSR